ncbi:MAG TPA: DUF4258 domain-containing protein [Capillimicrobium sp.]|nr:DUF4258 domain-containing protein [Capillimicrobium sp.]
MLRLSTHARQRMIERGITEEQIARILADYDVSFADRKGNPCYVRTLDGRRIKVVLAAQDPKFVITVIDLDA